MRVLIICVLLGFSTANTFAQNYIDIVSIKHHSYLKSKFDSSAITNQLNSGSFNLSLPFKISDKLAIISGVSYQYINTKLAPQLSYTLMQTGIFKMGINLKHANNWSGTYLFIPKISSDFSKKNNAKNYQYGILALLKKKKSSSLSYKLGFYLNTELFGPFAVPLFGIYYNKPKLEIDMIIPSYAKINYKLIPKKLSIGTSFKGTVKSFNIQSPFNHNEAYLHQSSNEIALNLSYNINSNIILSGIIGHSIGNNFRTYQKDEKIKFGLSIIKFGDNRTPLNRRFADSPFFGFSIIYRHHLDK